MRNKDIEQDKYELLFEIAKENNVRTMRDFLKL